MTHFIIFVIFSFFIPLVLMNMLIAIMSNTYARVQSNSAAADARQLAEMIQEMEEVIYFFKSRINPESVVDKYNYCFFT